MFHPDGPEMLQPAPAPRPSCYHSVELSREMLKWLCPCPQRALELFTRILEASNNRTVP